MWRVFPLLYVINNSHYSSHFMSTCNMMMDTDVYLCECIHQLKYEHVLCNIRCVIYRMHTMACNEKNRSITVLYLIKDSCYFSLFKHAK